MFVLLAVVIELVVTNVNRDAGCHRAGYLSRHGSIPVGPGVLARLV